MWPFKKRKKHYQKLIKKLEDVLKEKGIAVTNLFTSDKVLTYLAYFPFNHIFYRLFPGDINARIGHKEREFAAFIRKFKKNSDRKLKISFAEPPGRSYFGISQIGWRDNPRYEEELREYELREEEWKRQKDLPERKIKAHWQTPESKIYTYVKEEDEKTICSTCRGSGMIPAMTRSPGHECNSCKGTGETGYFPNVTLEQRQIAEAFEAKLESLKRLTPPFPLPPGKRKPVDIYVIVEKG
ncbi:MAG: hypothetical protein JSV88_09140 [Candidatus Aminicenantes bacterium]|nr:MAG: hypothetical protein JSV88_09140 [Candidatus Aminicenantes bacterium]